MEFSNKLAKESILDLNRLKNRSCQQETLNKLLEQFWAENPVFHQLVLQHVDIEATRKRIFNYLADYERKTLNSHFYVNMLDRNIARRCIHVLKNIFARRSEEITGHSALEILIKLAHHQEVEVSLAFIEELRQLFIGMKGNTGLTGNVVSIEHPDRVDHRTTARIRSQTLNAVAENIYDRARRYASGLDKEVISKRKLNRERIMKVLGATREEWSSWSWQCRNVIRDAQLLAEIIHLTPQEKMAVERATGNRLPFGITPYYLSLMDFEQGRKLDHAVRAQVIPPLDYVENVLLSKELGNDLDFMGEKDTSPVDLVTRRYPMVAIFKPYNTCAQICVYCQRNWEITDTLAEEAKAPQNKLETALDWFENNESINEVLVTGGDPGIMSNELTRRILDRLAQMKHIRRIRIGTRVPVVLPMRISDEYADILASYLEPGMREVCVMTHFEHPYEITPESMEAVQKLRARGIPVYNQTVFTMENARKFEMVSLRLALRRIGVDPYYTFNAKGKEETRAYRVPIARLIQEQTEEARLTPGLDRTDEAVFNIPRLGKSYLRAGQDHEVVMILPNGARVYEFYPWDYSFADTSPYLHEDVPILDFLAEMSRRGEDPEEYRSIWYYF